LGYRWSICNGHYRSTRDRRDRSLACRADRADLGLIDAMVIGIFPVVTRWIEVRPVVPHTRWRNSDSRTDWKRFWCRFGSEVLSKGLPQLRREPLNRDTSASLQSQ
jgi:hypothetical protein